MSKGLDRPAVRTFRVTLGVFVAVMVLSVFFAWPDNVIATTSKSPLRVVFGSTLGQGWAFFTNPPQAPFSGIYDTGSKTDLLRTPQGKVQNAFGITRAQRAQGPEIAILSNVASEWQDCSGSDFEECLDEAAAMRPQSIDPHIRSQSVCGDLILTVEKPTPWAFRSYESAEFVIEKYARIVVPCRS